MMKKKLHGTSDAPVQNNLKYGCDVALADRICNFNRRFAEHAGVCVCVCVCIYFTENIRISEGKSTGRENELMLY